MVFSLWLLLPVQFHLCDELECGQFRPCECQIGHLNTQWPLQNTQCANPENCALPMGSANSLLYFLQAEPMGRAQFSGLAQDRKSTRLNSSHQIISYAVF